MIFVNCIIWDVCFLKNFFKFVFYFISQHLILLCNIYVWCRCSWNLLFLYDVVGYQLFSLLISNEDIVVEMTNYFLSFSCRFFFGFYHFNWVISTSFAYISISWWFFQFLIQNCYRSVQRFFIIFHLSFSWLRFFNFFFYRFTFEIHWWCILIFLWIRNNNFIFLFDFVFTN